MVFRAEFIACIAVYLILIILFLALWLLVRYNIDYFDQIPFENWYKDSIFFIGDYNTPIEKKKKVPLREMLLYLSGIFIWNTVFSFIFKVIVNIRLYYWGDFQICSNVGWGIGALVAQFIGVAYNGLVFFLPFPYFTSLTLGLSRLKRGKTIARRMRSCLIATIIGIPFFLLSTDYYYCADDTALYVNEYFSFQEDRFVFADLPEMVIEENCDSNGTIKGISCHIKNEEGKRISILNSDLELKMISYLFSRIDLFALQKQTVHRPPMNTMQREMSQK